MYLCIGNNSDHIYCVDFGLSKRYRDPEDNNTHIQYYTGSINNNNMLTYYIYIVTVIHIFCYMLLYIYT